MLDLSRQMSSLLSNIFEGFRTVLNASETVPATAQIRPQKSLGRVDTTSVEC